MADSFFSEIVQLRLDVDTFASDTKRVNDIWLNNLKSLQSAAARVAKLIIEPHKAAMREIADMEQKAFDKYLDNKRQMAKINADVVAVQKQQESDYLKSVSYSTEQQLRLQKEEAAAEVRLQKETEDAKLRQMQEAIRYKERMLAGYVREQRAIEAEALRSSKPTMTVGRGLGAAAGGAAMLGQYNIAGGLYMAERLSYASGLGSKGLSALTSGAGLATVAIAGTTAAVAGLAFGAYKLAEAGSEVSKALADMSTLLGTVAGGTEGFHNQLDSLARTAQQLSIQFNTDLIENVKGMKEALSTGIDAGEMAQFMEQANITKNALHVTISDSVQILTSLKNAYGLSMNELTTANDRLFNIINVGKVETGQLSTAFTKILGPAAAAGISIEDLGGAFSTLSLVMPTYRTGTALTSFFNHIINPSKEAQKEMEKLGIHFGTMAFEARTQGHAIQEVIDEIIAKTQGDPSIIGKLFPEAQAKLAVNNLIQMRKKLDENNDAMFLSQTAVEANKRALDTFPDSMEMYGKAISSVVQLVGHDLLDAFQKVFFGDKSAKVGALELAIQLEEVMRIVKSLIITAAEGAKTIYDAFFGSLSDMGKDIKELFSGAIIDEADQASILRIAALRGQLAKATREAANPPPEAVKDNKNTGIKTDVNGNIDWFGDQDRNNAAKIQLEKGIEDIHNAMNGSLEPVKLLTGEFQNLNHVIQQLVNEQHFTQADILVQKVTEAYAAQVENYQKMKSTLTEEEQKKFETSLEREQNAIDEYGHKILTAKEAFNSHLVKMYEAEEKKKEDLEKSIETKTIARLTALENKKISIIKAADDKKQAMAEKLADKLAEIEGKKFKSQLDERGNPDYTSRALQGQIADSQNRLKDAAASGDVREFDRIQKEMEDAIEQFKSIAGSQARINGEHISDVEQSIADAVKDLAAQYPKNIDAETKSKTDALGPNAANAIRSIVQDAMKNKATSIANSGNITNNIDTSVAVKIQGLDPTTLKRRVTEIVQEELTKQIRERNDQVDTGSGETYPVGADSSRNDNTDSGTDEP